MRTNTHYTPTKNGYSISASSEIFNRTLYGSHKNDDHSERFFTFAGDTPIFMGALTDYTEILYGLYAKCGVLKSGLALTPGQRSCFYYSEEIDLSSRWFHNSEDITAEFKNGWMEYELTQISSWFPDVRVNIEAYPLLPDDGFLVHYKISTDQRVIFTAGFGGVTEPMARFEYKDEPKRIFRADDCKQNTVEIGQNRACIRHTDGTVMRIAASFSADFKFGSARALAAPYVSTFLGSDPINENDSVVKISSVIKPGDVLDGYIVVMRNTGEETLNKWLSMKNPIKYIKEQIMEKHACIAVTTPENCLDLTVAPTVIALDASWHKNSFHHGAFAYHAPFLGWRNWYAPTALGWHDRVEKTMEAHLKQLPKGPVCDERIWIDKTVRKGDGTAQYPSQYHSIKNSPGRMKYFLSPTKFGPYNMQECAFDMMLYHIEWTGNMKLAEKYFDDFCLMLDWEERVLDPDNDSLYQNFLNTWISDGHSYNGAGCAQSSAYNYRANLAMSKIAEKLGKEGSRFSERAKKIQHAVSEKLWIANQGVLAESIDTVGNCLIHPAPELSTVYLSIDCGVVDNFKAYTMLRYTENYIKKITTPGSGGRLSYSSNWLPKQYSNCGIFPAENAHLAIAYFKLGMKEKGKELLDGIVDCYFTGKNPGVASHIQSSRCTSDLGDLDFTDVSSTYLRLVVEGLFGIKIDCLNHYVLVAPNFPNDWEHASLTLRDIALHYNKKGNLEVFDVYCNKAEKKCIKIPMISNCIDAVLLDGDPIAYEIIPGPNNSFLTVGVDKIGRFQLRVLHGNGVIPSLKFSDVVVSGNQIAFELLNAELQEVFDISEVLEGITVSGNVIYAKTKEIEGHHTLFVHAVSEEYDAWLAADYEIISKKLPQKECMAQKHAMCSYEPINISKFFNCNMTDVHTQPYFSPRPEGYSVGVSQNGRYAWNWNHRGHNKVFVDDTMLRNANGLIHTSSGIPFATPVKDENLACVSIWDNFPTELVIPLSGNGHEIAILFISNTNPMQAYVENVRITVSYADGEEITTKLIYPFNIDDWLTPALQTQNEIFYFSDFNHATVQRINIDPDKALAGIKITAVANEVIMGVMGISVCN